MVTICWSKSTSSSVPRADSASVRARCAMSCSSSSSLRPSSAAWATSATARSRSSWRLRSVMFLVILANPSSLPALVADGGDDDVGPEARTVLAYAPALLLVAPGLGRRRELARRLPGVRVRLGVEDREVAADDLFGLVALETRGARTPCADAATGVQHEDGVVADALHHEAEPLLRAQQLLFCPLSLGDIPHRGHDQDALIGHHRAERDIGRELAAVLALEPDVQVRAHGPHRGLALVGGSVGDVGGTQCLRHQPFDRHADQLVARVPGKRRRQPVHPQHTALPAKHDDRVGHRLEQPLGGLGVNRSRHVQPDARLGVMPWGPGSPRSIATATRASALRPAPGPPVASSREPGDG